MVAQSQDESAVLAKGPKPVCKVPDNLMIPCLHMHCLSVAILLRKELPVLSRVCILIGRRLVLVYSPSITSYKNASMHRPPVLSVLCLPQKEGICGQTRLAGLKPSFFNKTNKTAARCLEKFTTFLRVNTMHETTCVAVTFTAGAILTMSPVTADKSCFLCSSMHSNQVCDVPLEEGDPGCKPVQCYVEGTNLVVLNREDVQPIVLQLMQGLQASALLLHLRVMGQQPQRHLPQPYLLCLKATGRLKEALSCLQHNCPCCLAGQSLTSCTKQAAS